MRGLYSGTFSWYDTRKDIWEYISLIHFPLGGGAQVIAYDQCIKHDANDSTFAALFDVDEFLVLKGLDNVKDFMDRYCGSVMDQQ